MPIILMGGSPSFSFIKDPNLGQIVLVENRHHLLSICEDFAGAPTGATLATPTAGFHFHVHGVYVSTETKTTDITIFGDTTGLLFKLYTSTQQTGAVADVHHPMATDEVIKVTAGAGTFVCVTTHEELA